MQQTRFVTSYILDRGNYGSTLMYVWLCWAAQKLFPTRLLVMVHGRTGLHKSYSLPGSYVWFMVVLGCTKAIPYQALTYGSWLCWAAQKLFPTRLLRMVHGCAGLHKSYSLPGSYVWFMVVLGCTKAIPCQALTVHVSTFFFCGLESRCHMKMISHDWQCFISLQHLDSSE